MEKKETEKLIFATLKIQQLENVTVLYENRLRNSAIIFIFRDLPTLHSQKEYFYRKFIVEFETLDLMNNIGGPCLLVNRVYIK